MILKKQTVQNCE